MVQAVTYLPSLTQSLVANVGEHYIYSNLYLLSKASYMARALLSSWSWYHVLPADLEHQTHATYWSEQTTFGCSPWYLAVTEVDLQKWSDLCMTRILDLLSRQSWRGVFIAPDVYDLPRKWQVRTLLEISWSCRQACSQYPVLIVHDIFLVKIADNFLDCCPFLLLTLNVQVCFSLIPGRNRPGSLLERFFWHLNAETISSHKIFTQSNPFNTTVEYLPEDVATLML